MSFENANITGLNTAAREHARYRDIRYTFPLCVMSAEFI